MIFAADSDKAPSIFENHIYESTKKCYPFNFCRIAPLYLHLLLLADTFLYKEHFEPRLGSMFLKISMNFWSKLTEIFQNR